MILIPCPHCGPRNSSEFAYVGERRPRPDPNAATPAEWRSYLYDKRNPAGWTSENWYHRFGCRKYLVVERHTVSGEVRRAEPADQPRTRSAAPPPAAAPPAAAGGGEQANHGTGTAEGAGTATGAGTAEGAGTAAGAGGRP